MTLLFNITRLFNIYIFIYIQYVVVGWMGRAVLGWLGWVGCGCGGWVGGVGWGGVGWVG